MTSPRAAAYHVGMNRRRILESLPLLALAGPASTLLGKAEAQQPATASPKHCTEPVLSECQAFPFESLPLRYSDAGAPTHQILEGRIPGTPDPAGEIIEIHETTLGPGKIPHPPHRHPHAELLLVRQGTIEFLSDAPPVRVTAGGAAYCAPGKLHGFHNVGDTEATYFVVKIGSAPVCQT